ncbi:MAG: zinc ribbon domain-containing protein [Gemmatimonadota bacterium]
MPTYEYRCGECGHQFEKFSTKILESSSMECPRCDGLAERLISGGAGLLFKGSGFYTTDYRSDSYKQAEKKDRKEPTSGASSEPSDSSSGKKRESKKDSK